VAQPCSISPKPNSPLTPPESAFQGSNGFS
jgi:hypothetical protein